MPHILICLAYFSCLLKLIIQLLFPGWKTMYKNNMQKILSSQGIDWSTYGKLIMGGEATMWSEQSDEFTVEVKIKYIYLLLRTVR